MKKSDFHTEVNDLKQKVKAPANVSPDDLRMNRDLIDSLPDLIKKYLKYASPLSDVPDEFLLTPFISMIGAYIGKKRYLKLGGLKLYPVVWTVIFAGSSTMRKSTALNLAKKPFNSVMDNWKADFEIKLSNWKERKKQAESEKKPFDEPKPKQKTLYCSDGFSDLTFWEGLRDNGNIISVASEFTALWIELTRSRNGLHDLALQIFDSDDSIRRNTRSGGDIELNNPVWCLAGATTLSAFQRSLTANERGSGLLQRIIPITIENRTKPFKAITELPKPDSELFNELNNKLLNLLNLKSESMNLAPDANTLFTQWSHELDDRTKKLESDIHDIGGYISRLNVYGLKFSLIFQTLDNPHSDISLKNVQASIKLCEWILVHIIFMLEKNYIFNRYYADRLKIRELLEKHGGMMNRTDLMNYSNFDKEQLDRAIENEQESGFIEIIKIETGKRPQYEYRLKRLT